MYNFNLEQQNNIDKEINIKETNKELNIEIQDQIIRTILELRIS